MKDVAVVAYCRTGNRRADRSASAWGDAAGDQYRARVRWASGIAKPQGEHPWCPHSWLPLPPSHSFAISMEEAKNLF